MNPASEIDREKKALRGQVTEQRRAMPFTQRSAADEAITQAVLRHPAFAAADQVFAYVSMPHEVGTRALVEACLQAGKPIGLPVCDPPTHGMTFYRLDAVSELSTGAYRIPTPPVMPERILHPTAETLLIVPMLAYDAEGYRLGAGGGYYDRWLAANPVRTIGICYADCRFAALPHDVYDQRVACCITERNTEDFYG